MTTKGQVTVPKAVREALDLHAGDTVVFRVEGRRAVIARTPDLLDLGGVIRSPETNWSAWTDVVRRATKDATR